MFVGRELGLGYTWGRYAMPILKTVVEQVAAECAAGPTVAKSLPISQNLRV